MDYLRTEWSRNKQHILLLYIQLLMTNIKIRCAKYRALIPQSRARSWGADKECSRRWKEFTRQYNYWKVAAPL